MKNSIERNIFGRNIFDNSLKKLPYTLFLIFAGFAISLQNNFANNIAHAAQQLRVSGSSTVYPFASVIAEQVARKTGAPPIIESTGTGSGLRSVCQPANIANVGIGNASRRIKASELTKCLNNKVDLIEFWFGRDGIVLAVSQKNTSLQSLSLKEIYLAIAKQIPIAGNLVANPYKNWSDIASHLPNTRIHIYGPPPTSGTRDALETLALQGGANQIKFLADLKKTEKKTFYKIANTIRGDGHYVESGENDNLLVRKLKNEPNAIAIFGFSYLDNNHGTLRGLKINQITPDFENIVAGNYPISRTLYFYVRKENFIESKNAQNYVKTFISPKAIGEEGYLIDKGLIPLSDTEYQQQAQKITSLETLKLQDLVQ